MPSDFPLVLARFIELYRHDPDAATRLVTEEGAWSETAHATAGGDRKAARFASHAAFIDDNRLAGLERELRARFPEIEQGKLSREFWNYLFSENPALDSAAGSKGWTREEFIRQIQLVKEQEAAKPDFEIYLANDFAAGLRQTAARLENLEEIDVQGVISSHLKTLLQEAHRCYLYGFELACAVLCGAILEEALRTVLNTQAKLEEISWDALQRGLITDEQYRMADEVRELRNEAAHAPKSFLRKGNIVRASMLSNTRAVLVALDLPLGIS